MFVKTINCHTTVKVTSFVYRFTENHHHDFTHVSFRKSDLDEEFPVWKFWKKRRYVVALMAFFGFFNVYSLRVNLSIAVVAMTQDRSETLPNGTNITLVNIPLNTFLVVTIIQLNIGT